jgi:hypothetical protein
LQASSDCAFEQTIRYDFDLIYDGPKDAGCAARRLLLPLMSDYPTDPISSKKAKGEIKQASLFDLRNDEAAN